MSTQIIEPLITVEQLASAPDDGNRYEVIEGEIFVSSAPAIQHQVVVGNLNREVGNHLAQNPTGLILPGIGVILSPYNGVIPDVVYVSNARLELIEKNERLYGAPELAIEILSPGKENEDRDRIHKLQLYSRYGVSEYWLINSFLRVIEIYRRTDARLHLHATLMENDNLTTPLLPDFSCAVSKIFAR
ncbi:MAG: Uma2 family endonuclease [Pyrinomonadaceae bacterium MAG19_C2-C3]|nr:Uma2 family endonuclease [Pyrinomonadaceae bacterium MAG19_C2-C3]